MSRMELDPTSRVIMDFCRAKVRAVMALNDLGMSEKDIIKAVRFTPQQVKDMLELFNIGKKNNDQ